MNVNRLIHYSLPQPASCQARVSFKSILQNLSHTELRLCFRLLPAATEVWNTIALSRTFGFFRR